MTLLFFPVTSQSDVYSGYVRAFTLIALCTVLYACGITQEQAAQPLRSLHPVVKEPIVAFDTAEDLPSAVDVLIEVKNASGAKREMLLLDVAILFYGEGDFSRANQHLAEIDRTLFNNLDLHRIALFEAKLALASGNPRQALHLIPNTNILPRDQQIEIYDLRASSFLEAGYPLEAAKTRVQLDALLVNTDDIYRNHQAIWESMSLLPETTLNQLSQLKLNRTFQGWIELAKVTKRGQITWGKLQNEILDWGAAFPDHPASDLFIREISERQIELIDNPDHIAILLPLSGRYAGVAEAIREGFMSAYYLDRNDHPRPEISFIDTENKPAQIWEDYQAAVSKGAKLIVGPLNKTSINTLARVQALQVPTLTLNYAEDGEQITKNLYQFGLLPEDEARQVAELAWRDGKTRAAVLVPESPWGERLWIAFQQRFEELGGEVLSNVSYSPDADDFSRPIQNMFNIHQSKIRYRQLARTLGIELDYKPYRRHDVDMIFIAATHKSARSIMPAFSFHDAKDVPVYATSHVYTGNVNRSADSDLNGLVYCDIPWTIATENNYKKAMKKLWPDQQRYTRLFALGIDAYHLLPYLKHLQSRSYERFSGQTGNLYLDPYKRIHRELLWARFRRGVPVLMNTDSYNENLAHNQSPF